MTCSSCSALVPDEAQICPRCGRVFRSDVALARTWRAVIWVALALLAGGVSLALWAL